MFIIKDNVLIKYVGTDKKVFIPNNVTKIQEKAFWNTQIEELHIPISVTFIDYFAFKKCVGLKNVYYDGSVEQFDKIIIAEFNDEFFMANTYYFKDEIISNLEEFYES